LVKDDFVIGRRYAEPVVADGEPDTPGLRVGLDGELDGDPLSRVPQGVADEVREYTAQQVAVTLDARNRARPGHDRRSPLLDADTPFLRDRFDQLAAVDVLQRERDVRLFELRELEEIVHQLEGFVAALHPVGEKSLELRGKW